ncbi:tyrosine-type recombinase/integrase [Pandoraea pnomenusa]|uniref:tyrosine-type recombinase/integrase n=1 Tax=Pandoraea pnomenusa TaxID=93220 RepID=UPI001198BBE1|nr:tyrosine-type recombinase/integrase [Pandoraea pnomenusa]QDX22494.1 tyrosine-type recombinase/integrase [Pandoraea pnomenusa]
MSIIKLPSGRWRLQIRRKHLKVDQVYDTEEAAQAAEAELLERHSGNGKGLTLKQLWERYILSQQFDDKAEKTQKTERGRIQPVLHKLGDFAIDELEANTGLIYDYIDARRQVISKRTKKRMSNTSVRLEIAALSSVVAYAVKRNLIRQNFVASISRPTTKNRKRRVAPREQGKLAIFARNGDSRIAKAARFLLLIRHLGCRPGELNKLLLRNISMERREVLFPDTKNKEDRCVHVTSDAATLLYLQLEDVPDKSKYLFSTWSHGKQDWVPYNYAHGVNILRELKVIEADYIAHAGRREFISRAIESSMPLTTIKKQTGHKTTQALEIYDQGLSTAPEIRTALDALAAKVKDENLMGVFEAAGLTPEQKEKMLRMMNKDGWQTVWPK